MVHGCVCIHPVCLAFAMKWLCVIYELAMVGICVNTGTIFLANLLYSDKIFIPFLSLLLLINLHLMNLQYKLLWRFNDQLPCYCFYKSSDVATVASCVGDGGRLAIHLSTLSASLPQELASKYGLTYLGPVGSLEGVHLFDFSLLPSFVRSLAFLAPLISAVLQSDPDVLTVYEQIPLLRSPRYLPPTDPMWPDQWVLHNVGQVGQEFQRRDLNVEPAWLQGLTGEGVIVGVVDDGIMYTHEDLKDNFIAAYSVDVADMDYDAYPSTDSTGRLHRHGTSCAGVLAMAKNNNVCGVGVAYQSKVAGIRLLTGAYHSDATEASALGIHNQHIDIYSNSWGPYDNGIIVEGPGVLTAAALEQGVREGRRGKGSIYVWASGNGGSGDCCSTDGYVASIYTIAVGSVDQRGQRAFYDEACPSKMVVVFHHHNRLTVQSVKTQTVTSSANGRCRSDFIGTSVACPLVAGAIALTLQANPGLTWRDIQYLLAYTARREGLGSPHQWTTNGGGLPVSKNYGFGAVDAEALVSRARHWISVPPQNSCSINHHLHGQRWIIAGSSQYIHFNVHMSNCGLAFLEHVVLTVSLEMGGASQRYSYSDYVSLSMGGNRNRLDMVTQHGDVRRGDVTISLMSPHGSISQLLPRRPRDFINAEGFHMWPFMSVRHWGESPVGVWLVNISYTPQSHVRGYVFLSSLKLSLYGTLQRPEAVLAIPKSCDEQCSGACGGKGPFMCDVCKSVRNAATLECKDSCSEGEQLQGKYCISSNNYSRMYSVSSSSAVQTPALQASPLDLKQTALASASLLIQDCQFLWVYFVSLLLINML